VKTRLNSVKLITAVSGLTAIF